MRLVFNTILILIIVMFTTNCTGDNEVKISKKIINDVEYVRSTNPKGIKELQLKLDEVFVLKDITINPSYDNDKYRNILKMDSENNLFILDTKNCLIKKYDSTGRFLKEAGGKGQGPGEFDWPSKIFFINDTLNLIANSKKSHLTFDNDLNFISSTPYQNTDMILNAIGSDKIQSVFQFDFYESENYLISQLSWFQNQNTFLKSIVFKNKTDSNIIEIYKKELTNFKQLDIGFVALNNYCNDNSNDNLFFVDNSTDDFIINKYNLAKQKLTRVIQKNYIPQKKPFLLRRQGNNIGDYWGSIFNLEIDKDDNLWIFSAEDYPTTIDLVLGSECYFQIFNKLGEYIGKVEVPAPPKAMSIAFDKDRLFSYDQFENTLKVFKYNLE
ncbi:MAG: hypothetical protein JXR48_14260 [Candidatus Delongbacteria bacterium]|nr:hypothetical protein [Candidatus Delongbacteria bacterium]MBN2836118.1 hypothetical protein [Candidatus Delongbacteria bacterium]